MNDQIDKKLILRESLALQRTTLANQTTILAFLRTAMYFAVAGLSTRNVLQIENSFLIELAFYAISFLILISGIVNFVKHRKKFKKTRSTLVIIN